MLQEPVIFHAASCNLQLHVLLIRIRSLELMCSDYLLKSLFLKWCIDYWASMFMNVAVWFLENCLLPWYFLSNGGEHCCLAECGIKMAAAGYGVFGIDYEGHGKSMGTRCYIQKFDNLVADCEQFFKSICSKTTLTFYFNRCKYLIMPHMIATFLLDAD